MKIKLFNTKSPIFKNPNKIKSESYNYNKYSRIHLDCNKSSLVDLGKCKIAQNSFKQCQFAKNIASTLLKTLATFAQLITQICQKFGLILCKTLSTFCPRIVESEKRKFFLLTKLISKKMFLRIALFHFG